MAKTKTLEHRATQLTDEFCDEGRSAAWWSDMQSTIMASMQEAIDDERQAWIEILEQELANAYKLAKGTMGSVSWRVLQAVREKREEDKKR